MRYLILALLLCGCSKLDKPHEARRKHTDYIQSRTGAVFYIGAACFDYPMGQDNQRVFRDGTIYEAYKKGLLIENWDDYNSYCKKYLEANSAEEPDFVDPPLITTNSVGDWTLDETVRYMGKSDHISVWEIESSKPVATYSELDKIFVLDANYYDCKKKNQEWVCTYK